MTPLEQVLRARIARFGPITIADFMADCLTHPAHGYYTTRDPLGAKGDFTTAPEISQMFGELIGLCLAQHWLDIGRPEQVALVELGPGRGTLMADLRRATTAVPGFADAASVQFIEASPTLRAEQAGRHPDATWHDRIDNLPDLPILLIANEFLDALPIRQFQREGAGWRERMVGLDEADNLTIGLSEIAQRPELSHRLDDTTDGQIVETCAPAAAIVFEISERIARLGGAALFIDYGDAPSRGDTFQAVCAHDYVDPLSTPGEADLTAHVDFGALVRDLPEGVAATQLTPQGVFLERLGLTPRAQALARSLSGDALNDHIAAHRRLTHPDEMGQLFKVLGLYRAGMPPPPGLDT